MRIRKPVTDENNHLCKKEEHGYQIDQEMTHDTKGDYDYDENQGSSHSKQGREDHSFHQNTYEEVKNYANRLRWLLQREKGSQYQKSPEGSEAAGALETRMEGGRVIL